MSVRRRTVSCRAAGPARPRSGWSAGFERGLGADVQGELEAGGAQIDGDDLPVAAVDQRGDGRQPDGSAPEDGDPVPGMHLGLLCRPHPDGQRLGQRGHVEWEAVGDPVEPSPVGLGDQEEWSETAFGRAVADPAELVVARLHDHPVTDRGGRDLGPDPVHGAGHLVAEAHRGAGRAGQATHPDVGEVAAADAAGRHPDDDVAGDRGRVPRPRRPGRRRARGLVPAARAGVRQDPSGRKRNDMASRMAVATTSIRTPKSFRW